MSDLIENLKKSQNLSFEESKFLFNEIMEGKYDEDSIIEILESLLKKGETKDELAGGIFVLREKATKVKTDENAIDTCGTGRTNPSLACSTSPCTTSWLSKCIGLSSSTCCYSVSSISVGTN